MPRTSTRTTTTRRTREILVKVGRVGDQVKEVLLPAGATVEEALEAAGITTGSGQRLRFKGESVDLDATLDQDGILTISGQIKGGR